MPPKTYKTINLLVYLCIICSMASVALARRSPSPTPSSGSRSGRWAAWAGANLNATLTTPNGQFGNFNVYNNKVGNLTLVLNCECEGTEGIYSSLTLRQFKSGFIPGTINSRGQLQSTFLDKSETLWNEGPTPGWQVEVTFDFRLKKLFVGIDHVSPDSRCGGSTFMTMKNFGMPYWGSGLPITG